jgi:hypothetical protein
MTTKLAMNLQYERTIALHLPIYFERGGESEREKFSSSRKYKILFITT